MFYHPITTPLDCPIHKLNNILHIVVFPPPGKWSNSFSSWNIEKGNIIWCRALTIQIFINPCKFMDINFFTNVNKCITLIHVYTWDLLRGNPILTPPLPLSANKLNCIISNSLRKLHKFILIKPTQYLPSIQLIYHFWNHIIPQSLFLIPNPFSSRQNCHMRRDYC